MKGEIVMAQWLAVSEELINSVTGEFPAYSYVGLYNLLYLAPPHDDILCATCATKRFRDGERIVYGTYDEGPISSARIAGRFSLQVMVIHQKKMIKVYSLRS